MTKRCPGKCGRILNVNDRMCPACKGKLNTRQRAQLESGVDVGAILASSTSYTSDSNGYSGGGDSGGGGGCD